MAGIAVETLDRRLAHCSPEEVLRWASDTFGSRVALASSFGAEDMVLIDVLSRVRPGPGVFAIDTGRLHEATYEVMERVRERYGVTIQVFCPQRESVEALEREHGFYSFRTSLEARHACCNVRKVEPLQRALSRLDAWITGLRREQSVTRQQLAVVEHDEAHGGILKLNPLADWTNDQVWDYLRQHRVPYNRLHDEGYPSIGCEPCTRAVKPGEHPRSGRWWWESPEHKECGLHVRASSADAAAPQAR